MKKVGIVTFHRAHNYGAMLQTFALQTYLSDYCDARVVDYHSIVLDEPYYKKPTFKSFIKSCIKLVLFPKVELGSKLRFKRFNKFRDHYFKLSSPYSASNIKEANSEFDIFINGSDQVWNPLCNGFDTNYFLSFADNKKKNSYAASFGYSTFDSKNEEIILNNILSFNNFSVREEGGKKLISKIGIKKDVSVDCDPVFLLSKEQWIKSLELKKNNKNGDYILTYYMAQPTNATAFALDLARKTGCKVLMVNHAGSRAKYNGIKIVNGVGPKEFLNLIFNAKYVVTTSFHGLALSLVFNIPVYFEMNQSINNRNSRLENLSKKFNLDQFEIKGISSFIANYNWASINKEMTNYVQNSKNNLVKILNE